MRLALAQINAVVGDLDGNRERILAALAERARRERRPRRSSPSSPSPATRPRTCSCDRRSSAPREESLRAIAAATEGHHGARRDAVVRPRPLQRLRRAARTASCRRSTASTSSPTTASSTSTATSPPGRELILLRLGEILVGPTICEDIWQPGPPATDLALAGAQLIVNLSASPFHVGKAEDREEMLVTRARDNSAYLAFCNLVGGQDELVFDGHSVVLDDEGEVLARAPGLRGGAARRRPRSERGDRPAAPRRPPPRARARARGRAPSRQVVELATGAAPTLSPLGGTVVPFDAELEQMRLALVLGAARLRREERLRRRRPRALGRHRLGARRDARRRRARAGARPLRLDAVALLLRGHADGCAAPGGRTSAATSARSRSRTIVAAFHDAGVGRDAGSPRRTCRPGCAG